MALVKGEDGQWKETGTSMSACIMPYLHPAVSRFESAVGSAVHYAAGLLTGLLVGKKVEKHARKNNPGIANTLWGPEGK